MRQFAFVIHPLDVNLVSVAFQEPNLINRKYSLVKKAFEWLPSFNCSEISGVRSITGAITRGNLIYLSLLPEQILSLDGKFVLDKVIQAGMLAQECGADILGLGAYAAQIGKKGVSIAKALDIPVTTGTHYTIVAAIESVMLACQKIDLPMEDACIAIVGATGKIGQVCSEYFSKRAGKLILVARQRSRLEDLKNKLDSESCSKIVIEDNVRRAMADADVSIMSTTTPVPLIDVTELKVGSIICDISRPRNVSNRRSVVRDDVLIIDGGIVEPPGSDVNFNFYFGLPKGLAYACMAETMILALEEKYECFSIGGNVTYSKVSRIGNLGKKHGFKLASVMSFDREVSEYAFENIHKVIHRARHV